MSPPIRDAATVILVRDRATRPRLLMGQRGAGAAFMPAKFVFPGGAVDPADRQARLAGQPDPDTARRLCLHCDRGLAEPLLLAAIRELWEETGLMLGQPVDSTPDPADWHPDWHGFLARGAVPSAAGLTLLFRAVTPPGRPRRFDARFFMVEAGQLCSDPDDLSGASGELSHLHWADLDAVRALDLPFITEVVLAEAEAALARPGPPATVPFFHHDGDLARFDRL
jgi:8-oxo-dGTP pyrophosphatase MutT (NUDIX family)